MSPPRHLLALLGTVLLGLCFLPSDAGAQVPEKDDDPEKVSNDQPSRPLQMPAASGEVKEAFDDFERFNRRGAWERATKALYAIPDAQATRFVDGTDGFIIPVARKRRAVLAGLPPEGLAAYRLFYDADAKKLLDQAEGPTEQATLEKLFSAYFLTTVGDNAGGSPGGSLLRARPVRPRRRLLAGRLPRAPRLRPGPGADGTEGGRRAPSRRASRRGPDAPS